MILNPRRDQDFYHDVQENILKKKTYQSINIFSLQKLDLSESSQEIYQHQAQKNNENKAKDK